MQNISQAPGKSGDAIVRIVVGGILLAIVFHSFFDTADLFWVLENAAENAVVIWAIAGLAIIIVACGLALLFSGRTIYFIKFVFVVFFGVLAFLIPCLRGFWGFIGHLGWMLPAFMVVIGFWLSLRGIYYFSESNTVKLKLAASLLMALVAMSVTFGGTGRGIDYLIGTTSSNEVLHLVLESIQILCNDIFNSVNRIDRFQYFIVMWLGLVIYLGIRACSLIFSPFFREHLMEYGRRWLPSLLWKTISLIYALSQVHRKRGGLSPVMPPGPKSVITTWVESFGTPENWSAVAPRRSYESLLRYVAVGFGLVILAHPWAWDLGPDAQVLGWLGIGGEQYDDGMAALERFFWLGSLVVLLELLAWQSRLPPTAGPAAAQSIADAEPPPVPSLEAFKSELLARFGSGRKRPVALTLTVVGREEENSAETGATIERVLREVVNHQSNVLIEETMNRRHIDFLVRLIGATRNHGAVILMVAPDIEFQRYYDLLRAECQNRIDQLTLRWYVAGEMAPDASQMYTVVMVRESAFESGFISQIEGFRRIIRRLEYVVILGMESLDLPFLRLDLQRLWTMLEGRTVSVLVQSEPMVGLASEVDNTIHSYTRQGLSDDRGTVSRGFTRESLAADRNGTCHWLIWNSDEAFEKELTTSYLPGTTQRMPIGVVLTIAALKGNFRCANTSRLDRRDASVWRVAEEILRNKRDPANAAIADFCAGQGVGGHDGSGGGPAPLVAIIDDHANLLPALRRNLNHRNEAGLLVQVVAEPYPLRDFLTERLATGSGQAPVSTDLLWPMAPCMRGSVTELLYQIKQKLENDTLSVTELRGLFQRAPRHVLESIGVTHTRAGVLELFRLILGRDPPPLAQTWTDAHEGILSSRDGHLGALPFSFSRRLTGPQGVSLNAQWAADDWGLAYAVGTEHLINGTWYRVKGVAPDHCSLEHCLPSSLATARPRYRFVNRYDLGGDREVAAFEEDKSDRLVNDVTVRHQLVHTNFKRVTRGYYRLDEGSQPFGRNQRNPALSTMRDMTIQRRMSIISKLIISNIPSNWIAGADGKSIEIVARTLAVSLYDLIRSLFPAQCHRIAVVWRCAPPASVSSKATSDARCSTAAALDTFIDQIYPKLDPPAIAEPDTLELLVIEDSQLDLGVARAIHNEADRILRALREYVSWCARDGNDEYYRFGASEPGNLLSFRAGRSFLNYLTLQEAEDDAADDN